MPIGLTPEEQRALILSVGTHRGARPLTPIDAARLFQKAISQGASLADCSALVHLEGTSMVGRFLRLLSLDPEVEVNIDWRFSPATIGFTAASEISRLPPRDHRAICQAAIEKQMPTSEIKEVVRLRLQTGKPIETCIEQVLRLRSNIETRYMFIGRIEDEYLVRTLEGIPQSERDVLFRKALVALSPQLKEAAARLTRERFSVVGGSATSEVMQNQKPDFETTITSAIRAELEVT